MRKTVATDCQLEAVMYNQRAHSLPKYLRQFQNILKNKHNRTKQWIYIFSRGMTPVVYPNAWDELHYFGLHCSILFSFN
jgi:hypothetical protein